MHWEKSILLIALLFGLCFGHGYLSRPASRNNMRLAMMDGQSTECPYGAGGCTVPEIDTEKQSGAAGGPDVVHGECPFRDKTCVPRHGMCGDKYDAPQEHMEGGKFSSGLVNGIYTPGQVIYLDLIITAHHKGYHEFTLYDISDDATAKTVLTPSVKNYPLKLAQPQSTQTNCEYWENLDPNTKWCMPHPTEAPIRNPPYNYTSAWVLPAGVTCKRCVLQWHWVTGNSPDAEPEEFWGCADITIRPVGPFLNDKQVTPVSIGAGYAPSQPIPSSAPQPPIAAAPKGAKCVAVPGKKGVDDAWCQLTKCDAVYVNGGFCQYVREGPTTVPSTPISVSTVAPTAAAATSAPTTAPTTAPKPASTVAPPASASARCKGVPSKGTTDAWCQQTGCDEVYVRDGYCVRV